MAVGEEFAVECNRRIEREKAGYLDALRRLNASRDANCSSRDQEKCLTELHHRATDFFNLVERCVVDSELLRRYRDEPWARDLANSAVNVLENIAEYYERIRADAARLHVAAPSPSLNAFAAMQSSVAIYNKDQVGLLKKRFLNLDLPVRGFTHPTPMNKRYANWEKIYMGIVACVFLLILLAIGVWFKDFTPQSFFIFRAVLALVGAAFAAVFIPGLLQVQGKVQKFTITAAGAVAVFVIIYLINQAELKNGASDRPAAPVGETRAVP
jgi:hypothetical protein